MYCMQPQGGSIATLKCNNQETQQGQSEFETIFTSVLIIFTWISTKCDKNIGSKMLMWEKEGNVWLVQTEIKSPRLLCDELILTSGQWLGNSSHFTDSLMISLFSSWLMTYPWQRLHVKVSVIGFSWDFMTTQTTAPMPTIILSNASCVTTHVLQIKTGIFSRKEKMNCLD